jgi:methionyl-tRNA synthetase
VRCLALLAHPFMPQSMDKMLDQLAVPANERDYSFLNAEYALKSGVDLSAPQGVFPRYVEEGAVANK